MINCPKCSKSNTVFNTESLNKMGRLYRKLIPDESEFYCHRCEIGFMTDGTIVKKDDKKSDEKT